MFYNHEDHQLDYRSTRPEDVYRLFNSLIESVNKGEEIREIGFRELFYVLNKIQRNWSDYYRYQDLMESYYNLFSIVNNKRCNFDTGAIYGALSISRRFLNEYLRRRHQRLKLAVNDIRNFGVRNELRRVGIRYQLMTNIKGHGRYSSLGEGQVVKPRYSCNVCKR